MNKLIFGDTIYAGLITNPVGQESISIGSKWEWEIFRNGKLIDHEVSFNKVVNEGLDFMLNVMFNGTAAKATWYCAIFEDDYTPLAANIYATPGYAECTAYGEATRPEYVEAASTARSTSNTASKAVFTMNNTKTVYGGSLVSSNVKGDTAAGGAVLFCSSKLAASKSVVSGDIINLTITITVSSTT
jgi:hypothetical protein